MLIPLKTFAPDADPTTEGVLTDCEGFMPTERGMRTSPGPVDSGITAAASQVYGAATVERTDGTRTLYMGTATDLFSADGTTWAEQTRTTGGDYTLVAGSTWYFSVFGNNVYAASNAATLQKSTGGKFADVSAGPKAEIIETWGLHSIALDVDDGASFDFQDGWWTSDQADPDSWTPDIATGAVQGRLYDTPGPIKAGKPLGSQFVAYKGSGAYLGTQIGPPYWVGWALVPGECGALGKWSVAQVSVSGAPAHFIVGPKNIYLFDGSRPTPIADGSVRRWFYSNLSATYAGLTSCVVDRNWGVVYVLFANAQSAGELNDCLIYSYRTGKWGRGKDYDARFGLQYVSPSATFSSVPTQTTFDAIEASTFDELFASSGAEAPAIVTIGNKISTLTGTNVTGSMTLALIGSDDAYSLVSRVRPRFSLTPDSATLTLRSSDAIAGPFSDAAVQDLSSNRFDVISEARWHQLRMTVELPAEVTGLDVTVKATALE